MQVWTLGPVTEGQRINLTILHFDLVDDADCQQDWLEIDYHTVHCGNTKQPWTIIGNKNTMIIRFRSNQSDSSTTGFQAVWTPTTAPPSYNFDIGFGCENCFFPFLFEGRRYQSCATLDGGKEAFCTNGIIPPSDDGTHISLVPPIKIFCYDTDSSCHRTPQISTHPENQHGNCCKFFNQWF